jgi:ABC-2 type transport system ATP-binding protein
VGRAIDFVRGFYPTWDAAYCATLMQTFGLGERDRIRTLSLGARMKLTLLLALSWRPALIVLDEPTVGLDAIAKQQLFAELLAAVGDGERSVLISSHGISDLERFADHVGMISRGRLLFEGPITDVVDRYRLVDFVAPSDPGFKSEPGVVVQAREADRWRVLVDRRTPAVESLERRGARAISQAPVSLEDLFVAMGRS